jgi:hypothetical protein
MDALQARPMPGTDDATYPFWSPDSRYIGFFAQGKLKKVAASGGPTQSLCDAVAGNGGSWNRDDVIVFSPSRAGAAIQRVPAAGGVPVDVTKTKGNYRYPLFLPDGRRFLYVALAAQAQSGVYLNSLDGSENRRVLVDASSVAFAAGRLLFVRENTLMAMPFDAKSAEASGDVVPFRVHQSPPHSIRRCPYTTQTKAAPSRSHKYPYGLRRNCCLASSATE